MCFAHRPCDPQVEWSVTRSVCEVPVAAPSQALLEMMSGRWKRVKVRANDEPKAANEVNDD